MTLFLFTAQGQLFALPGELVRQVLVPGAHDLSVEPGGNHARHAGRRLPIVALPEAVPSGDATQEGSTFLHLALPDGAECLLGVEGAGGLSPVKPEELLPLPHYLYPEARRPFEGLFLRGGKTGLLLRPESLQPAAEAC